MSKKYDGLIGARIGSLTFERLIDGRHAENRIVGLFSCDCGKQLQFPAGRILVQRARTHCGCQTNRATNLRHGMRYSPEYSSWIAMRRRCLNPRDKDYPKWGGVGITVCPEWVRSFEAFFAYIGSRPSGTSIDRIDPSKGYEPGNVRWATSHQQARNRKNLTVVKTPLGEMALVDYAKRLGITNGAAHDRLTRGTLEGVSRA
jgi:hypothetical protein